MKSNFHHPVFLAEWVSKAYASKYISAVRTVGHLWYEMAKNYLELYNSLCRILVDIHIALKLHCVFKAYEFTFQTALCNMLAQALF